MTIEVRCGDWVVSSSQGFGESVYDPATGTWTLGILTRTRRRTRRARVYCELDAVHFQVLDLTASRLRIHGRLEQLERLGDDVVHVVVED